MPIRFRCIRCHQLLGIAERKAGAGIECPRCGRAQMVPNKEAAEAAMLMGQIAGTPQVDDDPTNLVVYDDEPAAIGSSRKKKDSTPPAEKSAPSEKTSKPETKRKPKPKSRPKSQPKPKTKTSAGAKLKTKSKAKPGTKPENGGKAKPKTKAKNKAKPEPKAKPKTEPKTKSGRGFFGRLKGEKSEKAAERALVSAKVAEAEQGEPLPSGMILFPRRSFYVQAVLLVSLAGIAFVSGYFAGRGDANYELQLTQAAMQRTEIKGTLVHDSGAGLLPDENAVVIVLPDDELPDGPLATNGLGPNDSPPEETHEPLKAIVGFGGAYCRADAEGAFSMVVPNVGMYRMLIVSRNAKRPKDVQPDEVDVVEIEEYLAEAKTLIGRGKYRWTSEEVTAHMAPVEVNFGVNGQP